MITKMPLTRHFYSLDEVQAALLYTIGRNNRLEALFWCQELLLSGFVGEAISTLFQSWLLQTGPMCLQWLIDSFTTLASDELSEDAILLATYKLANCKKHDNSLWNILCLTAQNPEKMPDRITRKALHLSSTNDKKELYFINSIYQGKAQSAWWISQYMTNESIWNLLEWFSKNTYPKYTDKYNICLEALKEYDKLLGYKSAEYDVIIRCMAILMFCIKPKMIDNSFMALDATIDSGCNQSLNEWSKIVGSRARRLYSIPSSCLYGTTLRGRSKWAQNNYYQLNNIEKHINGCPFWDEVLEEYGTRDESGEIKWNSEEAVEEFYDKYFPDDIPDEWTKKDKQQSHGDGVLGPNDKPNIWKYARIHLSKIPHLAYNTRKAVDDYLEGIDISDCSIERICEHYREFKELSVENLKKLEPVKKIKIL
jgi:hypothetical protein